MKMSTSEKLGEALYDLLVGADKPDELFAVLAEFKQKYPRSYHGVRKQPFAQNIIDAIEEAHDSLNERVIP